MSLGLALLFAVCIALMVALLVLAVRDNLRGRG